MSKKDNLQEADGINKITPDTSEESAVSEKTNEIQTDITESEAINQVDETDETANDIVNDSEDHVEAVEKENALPPLTTNQQPLKLISQILNHLVAFA